MNTEHTMTKKTFTAYGNCQADALARVLMRHPEFNRAFDYLELPYAHDVTPDDLSRIAETMRGTDLLLHQFLFGASRAPALPLLQVMDALPPSAQRLSMPTLIFHGYAPQQVLYANALTLVGGVHDTAILHGFLLGLSADQILAVIRHPDFYTPAFCQQQMETNLEAVAKREAMLEPDLRIAAFLRAHWRSQRLFDDITHPRRAVLTHMAEQVLAHLGFDPQMIGPAPTVQDYRKGVPSCPIYPSTHAGLGLTFVDDAETCRTARGEMPLSRLIEELLAFYAGQDRAELQALVQFQRPFVIERYDVLLAQTRRSIAIAGLPASQSPSTQSAPPMPPTFELAASEVALLRAAYAPDAPTVQTAWQRWQAAVDLDHLPGEQFHLLPKLHANLLRIGEAGSADPRIAGIHRRAWYLSQRNKALSQVALTLLQPDGAPAIIVGDEAAATVYPSPGERPIRQLSLLTLPAFADIVNRTLVAAGWQSNLPHAVLVAPALLQWRSEALYQRGADEKLKLWWHFLTVPIKPAREERFVELAVDREIAPAQLTREALLVQAAATAALGGTDRLLALGDASAILLAAQPLNWDAVLELAYMLQVARPLSMLLATVSALFDLSVEHRVLARLAALGEDELPHESLPRAASGAAGWPAHLEFHRRRWRRIAKATKTPADARSLLAYVQAVAGAARPRDLPARLWQRWRQRPTPRRPHAPAHHTVSQQSDGR